MITQNPDYLITIVECGNLTKAAEKLYVSQPSLSQYIHRLEKSLNIELFDRSTSPMKLTYAGEKYYEYILGIKQMELNISEELQSIREEKSGRIRLGIALWRGACILPEVYPQFHEKFPKVKFELYEGRFTAMRSALENYEIDLMIANLLPAGDYADFQVEVITNERILIAAPINHPYVTEALKKNNPDDPDYPCVSLDILKHIPMVATKEGQSLTETIRSMLARENITPDILLETGNLTTAINLVAKGACCTFVPEEGARVCRHPGDVIFFRIENVSLEWELAFLYRKNSYLGPIRRSFIDHTKEVLRNMAVFS